MERGHQTPWYYHKDERNRKKDNRKIENERKKEGERKRGRRKERENVCLVSRSVSLVWIFPSNEFLSRSLLSHFLSAFLPLSISLQSFPLFFRQRREWERERNRKSEKEERKRDTRYPVWCLLPTVWVEKSLSFSFDFLCLVAHPFLSSFQRLTNQQNFQLISSSN